MIGGGKDCTNTNVKQCENVDANITTRSKVRSCTPISLAMSLGSYQYASASSGL